MSKTAIIVLADNETSENRGRILHALYATKELQDAGQDVKVIFEGTGVKWLTEFHANETTFAQTFHDLFEEVRPAFMGASNYVTTKRFDAADAAHALGVPLLGESGGHFSVGTLVQDGYQIITF